MEINFRFKQLAGSWTIIFDDGDVRDATEVEVKLFNYIAELHDNRLTSNLPKKIEEKKNRPRKNRR